LLIDRAKEIRQLTIDDGLYVVMKEMLIECLDRLLATTPWPEPLGAVQKQRCVDTLQPLLHHLLNDFILQHPDP